MKYNSRDHALATDLQQDRHNQYIKILSSLPVVCLNFFKAFTNKVLTVATEIFNSAATSLYRIPFRYTHSIMSRLREGNFLISRSIR